MVLGYLKRFLVAAVGSEQVAEAKAVNGLYAEYQTADEALKANITLAAQLIGQKVKDVQAQIDATLNS